MVAARRGGSLRSGAHAHGGGRRERRGDERKGELAVLLGAAVARPRLGPARRQHRREHRLPRGFV